MNIRAKRPLMYLYTIASLHKKDHVTEQELRDVYDTFFLQSYNLIRAYEIGPTYKQLHEHGVICSHILYQTSRFYIHKGFKVQLSIIRNLDDVITYVQKNEHECHSIINYYQESEAFSLA